MNIESRPMGLLCALSVVLLSMASAQGLLVAWPDLSPVGLAGGASAFSVGAAMLWSRHIAARRQALQAGRLSDSEACLRLAMKVTGLGLWDYRADSETVGSNEQTARLLGHAPEAFRETRTAFVARLHPDDRVRMRAAFRDYLQGARDEYVCEFRMRTREGLYRWFRSTGEVMSRDAQGQPLRVVGTYLDIHDQVEALRAQAELPARLLDAQETERRLLARELHDEIGQQLTAARLSLHALGTALGDAPAPLARVRDVMSIVEGLIARVRGRVIDLRPPLLDDLGLGPALEEYCRQQEERSQVCVLLDGVQALPRLSAQVECVAFRVVQEAVNNALKHGGADEVQVSLGVRDEGLEVTVQDNGRGFDPRPTGARAQAARVVPGVGLAVMRERVQLVGGRLDVSPGQAGVRVHAQLPLAAGEAG